MVSISTPFENLQSHRRDRRFPENFEKETTDNDVEIRIQWDEIRDR